MSWQITVQTGAVGCRYAVLSLEAAVYCESVTGEQYLSWLYEHRDRAHSTASSKQYQ